MATQELIVKVQNTTAGRTYSKTFKDIPAETITDVTNAKGYAGDYAGIVDGNFDGGQFKTVEAFDAT